MPAQCGRSVNDQQSLLKHTAGAGSDVGKETCFAFFAKQLTLQCEVKITPHFSLLVQPSKNAVQKYLQFIFKCFPCLGKFKREMMKRKILIFLDVTLFLLLKRIILSKHYIRPPIHPSVHSLCLSNKKPNYIRKPRLLITTDLSLTAVHFCLVLSLLFDTCYLRQSPKSTKVFSS